MKTIEAIGIITALNAIAADKRMVPSKFAYASVINGKRFADVAEGYEAGRKVVLDKYGEKDAGGKLVVKDNMIPLTDPVAFRTEMTALEDQVTDLKPFCVPLSEFPTEVTTAEMAGLMPMVLEVPAAGA